MRASEEDRDCEVILVAELPLADVDARADGDADADAAEAAAAEVLVLIPSVPLVALIVDGTLLEVRASSFKGKMTCD